MAPQILIISRAEPNQENRASLAILWSPQGHETEKAKLWSSFEEVTAVPHKAATILFVCLFVEWCWNKTFSSEMHQCINNVRRPPYYYKLFAEFDQTKRGDLQQGLEITGALFVIRKLASYLLHASCWVLEPWKKMFSSNSSKSSHWGFKHLIHWKKRFWGVNCCLYLPVAVRPAPPRRQSATSDRADKIFQLIYTCFCSPFYLRSPFLSHPFSQHLGWRYNVSWKPSKGVKFFPFMIIIDQSVPLLAQDCFYSKENCTTISK